MIGVVAYWSVHPWIEAHRSATKRWLSLFVYPLRTFGGTHFFMINPKRVEIRYSSVDIVYEEFMSIESLLKKYSRPSYVVLTRGSALCLHDYNHPVDDTIYVTGSDYGDVEKGKFDRVRAEFVKIEAGEVPLWANQASTIALYDRSVKSRH